MDIDPTVEEKLKAVIARHLTGQHATLCPPRLSVVRDLREMTLKVSLHPSTSSGAKSWCPVSLTAPRGGLRMGPIWLFSMVGLHVALALQCIRPCMYLEIAYFSAVFFKGKFPSCSCDLQNPGFLELLLYATKLQQQTRFCRKCSSWLEYIQTKCIQQEVDVWQIKHMTVTQQDWVCNQHTFVKGRTRQSCLYINKHVVSAVTELFFLY